MYSTNFPSPAHPVEDVLYPRAEGIFPPCFRCIYGDHTQARPPRLLSILSCMLTCGSIQCPFFTLAPGVLGVLHLRPRAPVRLRCNRLFPPRNFFFALCGRAYSRTIWTRTWLLKLSSTASQLVFTIASLNACPWNACPRDAAPAASPTVAINPVHSKSSSLPNISSPSTSGPSRKLCGSRSSSRPR